MKIAVSAQGKNLEADVDPKFGRASFFILVDSETFDFEVLENSQNINARQGAGIQSGKTIINSGAEILITKNCGPKAFDVLSSKGIKIALTDENISVKQAVEKFNAGELKVIDNANVEGHWA